MTRDCRVISSTGTVLGPVVDFLHFKEGMLKRLIECNALLVRIRQIVVPSSEGTNVPRYEQDETSGGHMKVTNIFRNYEVTILLE